MSIIFERVYNSSQKDFFETGHTLCSTAALTWIVCVLVFDVDPNTDEDIVSKLLTKADEIHREIQHKNKNYGNLSIEEVIQAYPFPKQTECAYEVYFGHRLGREDKFKEFIPDVKNVLHIDSLTSILKEGEAAVITANNHNVGIYRGTSTDFFIFDSLPASLCQCQSSDLQSALSSVFGNFAEFNFCLVSLVEKIVVA